MKRADFRFETDAEERPTARLGFVRVMEASLAAISLTFNCVKRKEVLSTEFNSHERKHIQMKTDDDMELTDRAGEMLF